MHTGFLSITKYHSIEVITFQQQGTKGRFPTNLAYICIDWFPPKEISHSMASLFYLAPPAPRNPQWHQLGIAFAPVRSHGESRPVVVGVPYDQGLWKPPLVSLRPAMDNPYLRFRNGLKHAKHSCISVVWCGLLSQGKPLPKRKIASKSLEINLELECHSHHLFIARNKQLWPASSWTPWPSCKAWRRLIGSTPLLQKDLLGCFQK